MLTCWYPYFSSNMLNKFCRFNLMIRAALLLPLRRERRNTLWRTKISQVINYFSTCPLHSFPRYCLFMLPIDNNSSTFNKFQVCASSAIIFIIGNGGSCCFSFYILITSVTCHPNFQCSDFYHSSLFQCLLPQFLSPPHLSLRFSLQQIRFLTLYYSGSLHSYIFGRKEMGRTRHDTHAYICMYHCLLRSSNEGQQQVIRRSEGWVVRGQSLSLYCCVIVHTCYDPVGGSREYDCL